VTAVYSARYHIDIGPHVFPTEMVVTAVRGAGIPLVVTLAGGYAMRVEDTVDIHVATIEEAGRTA